MNLHRGHTPGRRLRSAAHVELLPSRTLLAPALDAVSVPDRVLTTVVPIHHADQLYGVTKSRLSPLPTAAHSCNLQIWVGDMGYGFASSRSLHETWERVSGFVSVFCEALGRSARFLSVAVTFCHQSSKRRMMKTQQRRSMPHG